MRDFFFALCLVAIFAIEARQVSYLNSHSDFLNPLVLNDRIEPYQFDPNFTLFRHVDPHQLNSAYLRQLPKGHFLNRKLKKLFKNDRMFRSFEKLINEGFTVLLSHKNLMIAIHPSLPHHLIKKFTDDVSKKKQLENYLQRIEGAKILRDYIEKHHFKHLVVPEKWLYKLPKPFPKRSFLLIEDKMDIIDDWKNSDGKTTAQLYYNMEIECLTELCTLLHDVKGCDAFLRNQPFTRSGKIAFIDTEHVGQRKEHFITHIVPALNPDLQKYALELWMKLERNEAEK